MKFLLSGQFYNLGDLTEDMNKAFLLLHASYFGNHYYDLAEFKTSALASFDSHQGNYAAHDTFFNNFTILWKKLLNQSRFSEAEDLWDFSINIALEWEKANAGHFIHKGTPYYFWGMTTILKGDLDNGFSLMHQALEEDVRTSGQEFPDTPGRAFATLNYKKMDQAFHSWVFEKAVFLAKQLEEYTNNDGNLDLDQFQSKLLASPPSRDIVFLFAHTIARLHKIVSSPHHTQKTDFVGQLLMNLFFDITLVIDAVIQTKNNAQWKFIDHAIFLSGHAGLSLNNNKLGAINGRFNSNFEQTINEILDNNFNFDDGSVMNLKENGIALCYGVRNYGAHHVSSVATICNRSEEIRNHLLNTLFLAIEVLY